jgi:hypothetical protein
MADLETGETANELIGYAAAAGHVVTRTQLVRWHKRGLIPRPQLHYTPGRRGALSLYPAGTAEVLLVVAESEATRRPLEDVAWTLWWEGHERDMTEVRAFIGSMCDELASVQDKLRRVLPSGATYPGSRWRVRDYLTRSSNLRPPLGTVRRRLDWRGRNEFGRFVDLLLKVMVGQEPDFITGDEQIIERAFHFDQARSTPLHGSTEWFPAEDGMAFQWMANLVSRPLREVLDGAADDDLVTARDEVQGLIEFLTTFGETMVWIFGGKGLGYGFIGSVMNRFVDTPRRQAFLVLLLYAVRRDPNLRIGWDLLRPTVESWNTTGYRNWQGIKLIREELPEAQRVIGEARLREAFKVPKGWERLAAEVEVLRREHAGELDAVIAAHPDMFPKRVSQELGGDTTDPSVGHP